MTHSYTPPKINLAASTVRRNHVDVNLTFNPRVRDHSYCFLRHRVVGKLKIIVQFDVNVNNSLCLSITCHARYRAKAGGDKQHMQTMMTLFTAVAQPKDVLLMFTGRNLYITSHLKTELSKLRPKLMATTDSFKVLLPHQYRTSSHLPALACPPFPRSPIPSPPGPPCPFLFPLRGHMFRPAFTYSAIRFIN